jgi:nanoRNase/pAp phosphatase (c-di-AMP/oligoRNAs hydrolase)
MLPDLEEAKARGATKLDELRKLARRKKSLLALTHDYPDPDTIASALTLTWLLEELEGIEAVIGYGGIIGRAENKAMIKVLNIKMKRILPADFEDYDLVALLDTQPDVGNHSCPASRRPDIVFDHHFRRELAGEEPAYFDVGGTYGATSTKMTELLLASGLEPPKQIATALFYGVKSDTRNLARQTSAADVTAYLYLLPLIDTALLADIEHPQVPLDWFRVFNKAIMRAKIYGNMLVADLGSLYTPDLCAEVADRMLQVEDIKHAVATGWYEESLFMSLRTRSRSKNAGRILHSIVSELKLGTAGGHGPMAGARIPVDGRSQRARADIRRRLLSRLVTAFGQDYRHFQRILNPRDVAIENDEPPPPRAQVAG